MERDCKRNEKKTDQGAYRDAAKPEILAYKNVEVRIGPRLYKFKAAQIIRAGFADQCGYARLSTGEHYMWNKSRLHSVESAEMANIIAVSQSGKYPGLANKLAESAPVEVVDLP